MLLPLLSLVLLVLQMSYLFMCAEMDGDERIEAFIKKAFAWYCTAMESTEDHGRYLYTLISKEGLSTSEGNEGDGPVRK